MFPDNYNEGYGDPGGGGGYVYDPTLIPGYYNVMGGDPSIGGSDLGAATSWEQQWGTGGLNGSTQPGYSYSVGTTNYDPATDPSLIPGYYGVMGDPSMAGGAPGAWGGNDTNAFVNDPNGSQTQSDPGFVDPITGEWVGNPGYDPSTINNLPNVNQTPNVNPDPYGGQYDPTGGSGVPGDPYNLGGNTPVFQGGTTQTQDPSGSGVPGDPYNLGENTPVFTATGTAQQDPTTPPKPFTPPPSASRGGTPQIPEPPAVSNPPIPPFPFKTPLPGPSKPTSAPGQNSPTPSNNISLNMGGLPAISSTLPSSSGFSYQPISIARQGAPNAGVPSAVATQGGPAGMTNPSAAATSPLNPFTRLFMDQQKRPSSIYDTGL